MEAKELMEMREQLAFLKEKLEKQEIVNDKLIKNSMRDRVKDINLVARKQFICAAIACLIMPIDHYAFNLSWAFVIVTIIMMIGCVYATWKYNKPINDPQIFNQDVTTTLRTFVKVKQQHHNWIVYVTPSIIIPWILWFCYEYVTAMGYEGRTMYYACAYISICGLLGFILGYKWHKKAVHAMQEIIDQLRED